MEVARVLIIGIVVAAAGCTSSSPEVVTSEDRLSVEGNGSAEFTFWVENRQSEPGSYYVMLSRTSIARVEDSIKREEKYIYYLGDAPGDGSTTKKTVYIVGKPEELGELDSGRDSMRLEVFNTSQSSTDVPLAVKNVTVEVER